MTSTFARGLPVLLVCVGLAGACDDPPPAQTPQHGARTGRRYSGKRQRQSSQPAKRSEDFPLHVDIGPFLGAGCVEIEEGKLDCAGAQFVHDFGCESTVRVDDMLGGLAPLAAIVECRVPGVVPPAGLAQVGCKSPVARELVAWREGRFQLLDKPDAMARAFGPVKSTDAALGFALAMSANTRLMREVTFDDDAPVVPDVMPTNVLVRAQGYIVRLFDTQVCGCTHGDYAVDFLVTTEGQVTQVARTLVHTNPATTGQCVD